MCFYNGLVHELKEKQRKLSGHSKTMDLIDAMSGVYVDKSLNRSMCVKFESRKICVAGNQCDNNDILFSQCGTQGVACDENLFQ